MSQKMAHLYSLRKASVARPILLGNFKVSKSEPLSCILLWMLEYILHDKRWVRKL